MIQRFNKFVEYMGLFFYTLILIFAFVLINDKSYPTWINLIFTCATIVFEMTEIYITFHDDLSNFKRALFVAASLFCVCGFGIYSDTDGNIYGVVTLVIACILSMYGEIVVNYLVLVASVINSVILFAINRAAVNKFQVFLICFMFAGEVVILIIMNKNRLVERLNGYRDQSNSDLLRVLELKKNDAQRATKIKGDFIATMSHEIRTPMNAICGMADLLTQTQLTPLGREYVRTLKASSDNLLGIINDILDFSKIESGQLEFTDSEYAISAVVGTVQNIVNTRIGDKPVVFLIDVNPKLPCRLYGDEFRVQQVMLNLLSNAVKFTEKGCISLNIDYEMLTSDRLILKIRVKDTGIGIKPEDLKKLFSAFTQVDMARNRNIEGTGLGLAITAQIVKQLDGKVTAESVYGEGSEFVATLEQDISDSTPCDASLSERRDKILYIFESDERVREGLKRILDDILVPYIFPDDFDNLKTILKNQKREIVLYDYDRYQTQVMVLSEEYENVTWAGMVGINRAVAETTADNICYLHKPITMFSIIPVIISELTKSKVKKAGISSFYAPNARALVVDDTPANIKVAEGFLEQYKIETVCVESGEEALAYLDKDTNFDILFIDHMMPEMDGVELVRRIRNKEDYYFIMVPIVALTANAIKGIDEMFLKNGFDDFLPKPIDIRRLGEILAKWLPEDKQVSKEDFNDGKVAGSETEGKLQKAKDAFEGIPGFSLTDGLALCDDNLNILLSVIRVYVKAASKTIRKLSDAFVSKDDYTYGIEAHGLKSASRSIGANTFSDKAKSMEHECKSGHWEYILAHHVSFISEYEDLLRWLREALEDMDSEQEEKNEAISDVDISKELDECKEYLDNWEAGEAMKVINRILEYKLEDSMGEMIREIGDSIELFDYNIAIEKIVALKGGQ